MFVTYGSRLKGSLKFFKLHLILSGYINSIITGATENAITLLMHGQQNLKHIRN